MVLRFKSKQISKIICINQNKIPLIRTQSMSIYEDILSQF